MRQRPNAPPGRPSPAPAAQPAVIHDLSRCPACGLAGFELRKERLFNDTGAASVARFYDCRTCGHSVIVDHGGRILRPGRNCPSRLADNSAPGRAGKPFLTIPEAARRIGCSQDYVLDLLHSGDLSARFEDGTIFVRADSISTYLRSLCEDS